MSRELNQTKAESLVIVERLGEASPKQIADALGGEWPAHVDRLGKMLRRMVPRHLQQLKYGVYSLAPNYRLRSFDNSDAMERAIVRLLTKMGGHASTRAIHEALGDRAQRARDYTFQLIKRVLKESPRFENYGWGRWRLV